MKAKIVYKESYITFSKSRKQYIEKLIGKTARHAGQILKMKGPIENEIIPTVRLSPRQGLILSETKVRLFVALIDPDLEIHLKSNVYHEIYHLARIAVWGINGGNRSLIADIFSEGLAIAFEMENLTHYNYKSPYSSYDSEFLQKSLTRLRAAKNDVCYDQWFDQVGLGYRMGKYFIDLILKRYPYLNSVMLVRTDTAEMLDLLYASGINLK